MLNLFYMTAGLAPIDDAFAFAQMQAFHMYIATTIHITFRQISRPEAFADGEAAKLALKAKVPAVANQYFSTIEQQLADGRTWIHGENYSMSDPYLFGSQVTRSTVIAVIRKNFRISKRIGSACENGRRCDAYWSKKACKQSGNHPWQHAARKIWVAAKPATPLKHGATSRRIGACNTLTYNARHS